MNPLQREFSKKLGVKHGKKAKMEKIFSFVRFFGGHFALIGRTTALVVSASTPRRHKTKLSSCHGNYDESKGGSTVKLLYSDKVCAGRIWGQQNIGLEHETLQLLFFESDKSSYVLSHWDSLPALLFILFND